VARYELLTQEPHRYVDVSVDGKVVSMLTGVVGAAGKSIEKSYVTSDEAWREYQLFVRQLLERGYVASNNPREERDGEEEPAEEKKIAAASVFDPALEAAIDRNRADPGPYLVYADWLQSKGDPRGELIVVQHKRSLGDDPKARDRERQLLATHTSAFLGPLADMPRAHGGNALVWRHGFVRAAFVGAGDGRNDIAGMLDAFLSHPSARFLEELSIGLAVYAGGNDYSKVVQVLLKHPEALARLVDLTIGEFEQEECEISWAIFGDLSGLWPHLGRLQRLTLHGGTMKLGAMSLPSLTTLRVETGGLALASLESILRAQWPALERMEIWFGSPDYGGDCGVDDVGPLLESPPPKLVHLGLRNAAFTDALVERLHGSKALAQVHSLDLSMGCLTEAGAGSLKEHATRYRHLSTLDLSDNCLADVTGLESLAKVVVLGRQQPDRIDEDRHYPSVGE
jgi:uncharacterized protein (TIGR02996 family)